MSSYTHPLTGPKDGKEVFKKMRTCSRTFFYLLNREFGHPKTLEERAADTLAGGILQEGHQCGMLWGASLAIGAEAYRMCDSQDQAIRVAVNATQNVMRSFKDREGTINCRTITRCDFSNKLSFAKYMLTRRYRHCFALAQEWAPEAVQAAISGLSNSTGTCREACSSCAAIVARQMGATEEEMVMVSGFAGGLGLSGAGCGALAAAIWMHSIRWCREDDRSPIKNPSSNQTLESFYRATDFKIRCDQITGTTFATIDKHTEFLKGEGCASLIKTLSTT